MDRKMDRLQKGQVTVTNDCCPSVQRQKWGSKNEKISSWKASANKKGASFQNSKQLLQQLQQVNTC